MDKLRSIRTDVFPQHVFTGTIDYVADRGDEAHNYVVRMLIKNTDQRKFAESRYVWNRCAQERKRLCTRDFKSCVDRFR